jgi:osmotically-inducible protein OsmY
MKRSKFTAIACSALVIAGCAHKQEHAKYESNTSDPVYGTSATYNNDLTYNRSYREGERTSDFNPQGSTTFNDTTVQTQTEPSAADSALVSQVRTAINNDTTLVTIAPSIQVMANSGTVTLSGNVSNEQQKLAIEQVVKGTSGVVTVNNQLQVAPSPTGSSSQSGQSSLYYNAPRQGQGSISGSTSDSSAFSGGVENKSALYSNAAGASAGATGESSLSSTDSAQGSFSSPSSSSTPEKSGGSSLSATNESFSPSPQASSSSLSSTNSSSGSPNLSSSASSSSSLDTNKQSFVSGTAQGGTSSDTSSSSGSAQSETKDKDLSATSQSPSPRLYSTNGNSQSSDLNSSSSTSSGGSANLTVQGTSDADQKLADQVRQELKGDTSLSGSFSSLRISLENGKATLRGFVKSDQDKQNVEKSVQKITGVTSVQNELRVSGGSSSSSSDSSQSK